MRIFAGEVRTEACGALSPSNQSGSVRLSVKPTGSIMTVLRDRVFMTFVALNLGLWVVIESCKLIPIAMHQRGLEHRITGLEQGGWEAGRVLEVTRHLLLHLLQRAPRPRRTAPLPPAPSDL